MNRNLYKDLLDWKNEKTRKPLLLKGARQVGKTFILKSFGQKEFPRFHHFDFGKDKKIRTIFEGNLNPLEIIKKLEVYYNTKINPREDLIIFDEIQDCPGALSSLKYFCEDLAEAFVIGSGSFLGVSLTTESFPVGKIKTLTLYPMTFFEFLEGLERKDLLEEITTGTWHQSIHTVIHEKAFEYLKYYFITGGLPEIVNAFRENFHELALSFSRVRELQSEILDHYLNDMAKHSGKMNAVKIQAVFNNVPVQLARENKTTHKFVFKDVLPTRSNYEQLEDPILWLVKAGLIHKILICKKAEQPLKAFTDHNKFKLYLFDVGLLGLMIGLQPKDIYQYDYGCYKGYFAENFVVQELAATLNHELFSWQEGTSEIELLLPQNGRIVPVEVKAGTNTKAKSLSAFNSQYRTEKSFLLSASPLSIRPTGQSFLPLYSVALLPLL